MAWEGPQSIKIPGLVAGADLSAKQYLFVKLDGSGDVVIASSQGEQCIGVLQNKPTSGQAAEVVAVGVTKLKTDGTAHAEMGKLTTAADGEADLAESGDHVLGVAITTPTASAGVAFTALVNCSAPPVLA